MCHAYSHVRHPIFHNHRNKYVDPLNIHNKYVGTASPHFPTGFNQFRKFPQRGDICFQKAKRAYKKTSLSVKSDKSVFWRFLTQKLENFETRFWTRDTCHVSSEGTMSWALSSRQFQALKFFNLLKKHRSYGHFCGGV